MIVFGAAKRHIAWLEGEVEYLRVQAQKERDRANQAVDTLLAMKVGAPPVTPPTPEVLAERRTQQRIDRALAEELASLNTIPGDLPE